ncbi:MAG TPA: glycosyltransferase family 4 protein [Gemmatimonadales bacterium]|nr:glycosyltransferase family 4 protein [Gemmatimonadales bacterium]
MRVVFLTHNYPRRPGDPSGAALATLARALMRRGISVRVVTPSDESGSVVVDGVPVIRVRAGRFIRETISHSDSIGAVLRSPIGWVALSRLRRSLRAAARHEIAAGADLVHAHGWMPAGLAAPTGIPLVLTVDGTDAPLLKASRVARWLARPLFQRAAVVTTVSREVGTWVQTGAGRFVDNPHIHPLPADTRGYPWTRGGGGLLVISRLVASKRVELAIETAAVLVSSGHDFPLTIIGDGPERASLEQRAARLGVSSLVRFSGALSPSEARAYFERADILLFTARGDGTALPAIEALVSGVPVVACWDSGAAVDIVPESGPGRLTLPAPEALADSVLNLQADPDRLTMGRLVGESWRARLAPDNVAELCEGWYRNALAG